MADYASSLPIRTETAGDAVVKIVDTGGSNEWSIDANSIGQVNLNDGTNSLVIGSSGELTVTPSAAAKLIVWDGTENLLVNTDGSLSAQLTDGTNALAITASGEITVVQASGNEIKITDGTDDLAIQTDGSITSRISDGTDSLAINTDGSINVVTDFTPGTDIHVYGTTVAGVPGVGNSVIDRVQSGAILYIKSFQATCSAKFKVELKTGTDASETTKVTAFGSTSSGFVEITFPTPIAVADGDSTLLVITNNDKANADVYGFINGYEV